LSKRTSPAPRRANAEQSRAYDARAIDDQHVARIDQRREVREGVVLDGSRRAMDDHQPARVAPLERTLRDTVGG
jgi:hypothetical protein